MLTLSLNGEAVHLDESVNLTVLLEQQGFESQKIAAAINGEFVPRSQYANTAVRDGDQVDIIQAVGGG